MRTEGLRDRLVSSLDSKMITELLKVKLGDLSFDLALQKSLATEQAGKDVQVLQGEQGPGTHTDKFGEHQASPKSPQKTQGSQGRGSKQPKPGYRFTGSHNSQKCPFTKEHCYHSGIIGHTQQARRKKQATQQANGPGVNVMEGVNSEEGNGEY